jgi:hypothetical protein
MVVAAMIPKIGKPMPIRQQTIVSPRFLRPRDRHNVRKKGIGDAAFSIRRNSNTPHEKQPPRRDASVAYCVGCSIFYF